MRPRCASRRNRKTAHPDVAHDLFAASSDASLNSIDKAAGVGPGTLNRHFPTREALVLAVYRHYVLRLVNADVRRTGASARPWRWQGTALGEERGPGSLDPPKRVVEISDTPPHVRVHKRIVMEARSCWVLDASSSNGSENSAT
jgi:AcrR family transcriptional regulator